MTSPPPYAFYYQRRAADKCVAAVFCRFVFQRRLIGEIALGGGVLVTSYSHVVGQLDTLLQHDWHYVVLDEGHKIRNPDAQVTLAVKQVSLFVVPALRYTVNLNLM